MKVRSILVLALLTACGSRHEVVSSTQAADTVCQAGPTIEGVDVSEFQGNIDWGQVRASGRLFAFIRVGDGHYFDPLFDQNWSGAKGAGVIRGADGR